jgi:hypothetical protein
MIIIKNSNCYKKKSKWEIDKKVDEQAITKTESNYLIIRQLRVFIFYFLSKKLFNELELRNKLI